MTAISDFMIFGGAVMMSALVGTSAQMVTLASTLEVPPVALPPMVCPQNCAANEERTHS